MGGPNKELFIRLLCEFLASFFVQFFGCGFSQFNGTIPYALTWGCAVVATTHAFRIISGAHINPCITIAAMILEVVNPAEGLLYICFQLIGSAVGFGVAYGILDNTVYRGKTFCVAVIELTPWWKSLFLEIFLTGAWVFAMCASWERDNINLLETVSLRIGMVVAVCHLAGGAQTGCSMNPFRALWPAVAADHWKLAFIPLVVPVVTAILLALAWRFIYVWGRDLKYYRDYEN